MIKVSIRYTEVRREEAGNLLSIKRCAWVEAEIDEESMVTSMKQAQNIVDALPDSDKYVRTVDDIEILPVSEGNDPQALLNLVDFSLDHLEPKIYPVDQSTSNAPMPDLIKPPIFDTMLAAHLSEGNKPVKGLKEWASELATSDPVEDWNLIDKPSYYKPSPWVTTTEFLENHSDFELKIDPELEKQLEESRAALLKQLEAEESKMFNKAIDAPLYNTTGTIRGRLYMSPELRKALTPEMGPSREQLMQDMQALLNDNQVEDYDTGIDEWLEHATDEQLGLWHKGMALKEWYKENMQPQNTQDHDPEEYNLGIPEPKQVQIAYLDEEEVKCLFGSVDPEHKETLIEIGESILEQLSKTTGKEYVLLSVKEHETLPCYGMSDTEMTLNAYKKRTDTAKDEN